MEAVVVKPAAAAEVVDASGAHRAVASLAETSPATASNVFTALFTRTAGAVGEVVADTAKVAAATPNVVASAVPAMGRALQSIVDDTQRTFHIERLSNPLALIGDAAAAFAEESALLGSAATGSRYLRAWSITGVVVALDAAVLVYWLHSRRRRAIAHNLWSMDMTDVA
jgi:hypothetical protein